MGLDKQTLNGLACGSYRIQAEFNQLLSLIVAYVETSNEM